MTPTKKASLAETLTGIAPLPEELRRAPRERQERKVKASALGFFIMLLSLPMFAFTGFFAYQTRENPPLLLLGASAGIAMFLFALGAIAADPETIGPVIKGLVRMIVRARKP